MNYIKIILKFYLFKGMVLKSESRSLNSDQIFAPHITDSGLESPIFKEFINRLKKKITQKQMGKRPNSFSE